MICLVRQETESVLHRHNVVLESEVDREASERWFAHDQNVKRQKLRDSSPMLRIPPRRFPPPGTRRRKLRCVVGVSAKVDRKMKIRTGMTKGAKRRKV